VSDFDLYVHAGQDAGLEVEFTDPVSSSCPPRCCSFRAGQVVSLGARARESRAKAPRGRSAEP
jgi:hypothetical protein